MKSKELNVLDYLAVLVRWRKLIVLNCFIVCVIAVVISLLLPKWYRAETTLMPPTDQTSAALGLATMLSELPIGEFSVPGMQSPYEIFKAILESRTVAEGVIVKNSLVERYKKKNVQSAVRTLHDHSQVKISDDGIIIISAEDRDPQLAAKIANSFVEELDKVNQQTSSSQARSTRVFIERRLGQTKDDLRQAEDGLRLFQEENKTASLPDQVAALIQGVAELRAQQVALEVERGVLEQSMSGSHPRIMKLQLEIDELQKQIDQVTLGLPEDRSQDLRQAEADRSFNVPLIQIPSVGLQLARLTREVKIQEAIFQLLTQQYEQAKIQEAKDTPTVQVLDKAVAPQKKSRPKRMIIVALWGALSLVFGVICAFSLEYWKRMETERNRDYESIRQMLDVLKNDVMHVGRIKRKRSIGPMGNDENHPQE